MVVLGTDAHKRNHTVVAVDGAGVEIGSVTVAATPEGHLRLVKWAATPLHNRPTRNPAIQPLGQWFP